MLGSESKRKWLLTILHILHRNDPWQWMDFRGGHRSPDSCHTFVGVPICSCSSPNNGRKLSCEARSSTLPQTSHPILVLAWHGDPLRYTTLSYWWGWSFQSDSLKIEVSQVQNFQCFSHQCLGKVQRSYLCLFSICPLLCVCHLYLLFRFPFFPCPSSLVTWNCLQLYNVQCWCTQSHFNRCFPILLLGCLHLFLKLKKNVTLWWQIQANREH